MSEVRGTQSGRVLFAGTGTMVAALALAVTMGMRASAPPVRMQSAASAPAPSSPAVPIGQPMPVARPVEVVEVAVAAAERVQPGEPVVVLDPPTPPSAVEPVEPEVVELLAVASVSAEERVAAELPLPPRPRRLDGEALLADAYEQAARLDVLDSPDDVFGHEPKERFRALVARIRLTKDSIHRRIGSRSRSSTRSEPMLLSELHPLLGWLKSRSDLDGLTMLEGDDCIQSQEEAGRLAGVSNTLAVAATRVASPRFVGRSFDGTTESVLSERDRVLIAELEKLVQSTAEVDASGVHQVLQIAPPGTRERMVGVLVDQTGEEATRGLVQRALFDHEQSVRQVAVLALARRPPESYRDRLLAGFEHPWPAAADNAADAIVALEAVDLVDDLLGIADRPDPRSPVRDEDGGWHARELVRVNHLRNCLLCHAPVTRREIYETASGTVPNPYAPLPSEYYGGTRGLPDGPLVRADVTYLWQDFSMVHSLDAKEVAKGWPTEQRFDYLVRNRPVGAIDAAVLRDRYAGPSPQREAARYAARYLDVLRQRRERLVAAK